jgi:hypothetical protein
LTHGRPITLGIGEFLDRGQPAVEVAKLSGHTIVDNPASVVPVKARGVCLDDEGDISPRVLQYVQRKFTRKSFVKSPNQCLNFVDIRDVDRTVLPLGVIRRRQLHFCRLEGGQSTCEGLHGLGTEVPTECRVERVELGTVQHLLPRRWAECQPQQTCHVHALPFLELDTLAEASRHLPEVFAGLVKTKDVLDTVDGVDFHCGCFV